MSRTQHEFAKTAEEERSHMTDLEYKILKIKKKRAATDVAKDSSDANVDNGGHNLKQQNSNKSVKRDRKDTEDKVEFRRKKAKV